MITLEGFAVKDFLQGYLTCDSARINKTQPTPMALCTLKGRVLANGWALELDSGVGLIVHKSLAQDLINFLKPYAMFAKCTFSWVDEGLTIKSSQDTEQHFLPGWAIALDKISTAEQSDLSNTLSSLMAEQGMVFISKPLSQRFLPQMLDLHIHGAVDFDKGCYLGQEIVARAQFRGAVKKQLAEFSWQGVAPVLGDTWQNPQGTKGDVIYVSRNDSEESNLSGTGLWVTRKAKEDVEQSAS